MKIIQGPHKTLSTECVPCGGEDVSTICNALLETVNEKDHKKRCVGLAANQLGFDKRVCVVKIGSKFKIFIDPEIVNQAGEQESTEGCLSWPGKQFTRIRAVTVWVSSRGKKTIKLSGLSARVIQHEIDHLDGKYI